MRRVLDLAGALAAIGLLAGCGGRPGPVPPSRLAMPDFAPDEVEALRSLWLGSLPELPDDPSNRVADDSAAAALGEAIFADTRFSANGEVSCSTCHQSELNFTDGLPRARGIAETQTQDDDRRRHRVQPLALLGRAQGQPVGPGARADGGRARARRQPRDVRPPDR